MVRVRTPEHMGFPHDLGIQERAALMCYGRLVAEDPAAASYESVCAALGKEYSTVKNQLDAARKKMGTNTTWGAYLLMMAREKVQAGKESKKWEQKTLKEKPGQHSSRLVKTGKGGTRRQLVPEQAAS